MAEESFQERTEEPTQRRREEAREEGQVARSVEINSAIILLFGILSLFFMGGVLKGQLTTFMQRMLREAPIASLSSGNVYAYSIFFASFLVKVLSPIFGVLIVAGLLANILQVGFLFSTKPLAPKFNKLNPASGVKKLFSKRSLEMLIRDVLKVALIGYVAYRTVKPQMGACIPLVDAEVKQIFAFAARMTFQVGIRTAIVMLILAALDYLFQRYEHTKDLRMTKEQVKEEQKRSEGDPLIKSRVRSIQREMARKRMMASVPEADVVITNPVRLAVALKYDPQSMKAPSVVAKGERLIAAQIKRIAQEAGVPIIEDKPLARALYKAVEVGMEVPQSLYRAVAEVLAYVFRMKRKV